MKKLLNILALIFLGNSCLGITISFQTEVDTNFKWNISKKFTFSYPKEIADFTFETKTLSFRTYKKFVEGKVMSESPLSVNFQRKLNMVEIEHIEVLLSRYNKICDLSDSIFNCNHFYVDYKIKGCTHYLISQNKTNSLKLDVVWTFYNMYGKEIFTKSSVGKTKYVYSDIDIAFNEALVASFGLIIEDKDLEMKLDFESKYHETKSNKTWKIEPPESINGNKIKLASESVVTIKSGNKLGSGFIISESGLVITSHDLIRSTLSLNDPLIIKLHDGTIMNAKVLKYRIKYDLALLKIDSIEAFHYLFLSSSTFESGDVVYSIGTSIDKELGQSVSKGIISNYIENSNVDYYLVDCSSNIGGDGGPIISESGDVIGVVTSKLTRGAHDGLNVALTSLKILELLNIEYR